jgi:hypothetical protein
VPQILANVSFAEQVFFFPRRPDRRWGLLLGGGGCDAGIQGTSQVLPGRDNRTKSIPVKSHFRRPGVWSSHESAAARLLYDRILDSAIEVDAYHFPRSRHLATNRARQVHVLFLDLHNSLVQT